MEPPGLGTVGSGGTGGAFTAAREPPRYRQSVPMSDVFVHDQCASPSQHACVWSSRGACRVART
eukprot:1857871-Prymnesium_polylepis.1